MSARQDDNFRQMLRGLPRRGASKGATPRVVDMGPHTLIHMNAVKARRRQKLGVKVSDASVLQRVASLVRTK